MWPQGMCAPPPARRAHPTYAQGVTEQRHGGTSRPDGFIPHSPASGHLEDHPRWIAITPSNARRVVLIVLSSIVLLWVALWAFAATSGFLFLLLLAWLLSIAMEPAVLWLSERGMRRGVATGLTMLGLLVVVAGLARAVRLGLHLPAVRAGHAAARGGHGDDRLGQPRRSTRTSTRATSSRRSASRRSRSASSPAGTAAGSSASSARSWPFSSTR